MTLTSTASSRGKTLPEPDRVAEFSALEEAREMRMLSPELAGRFWVTQLSRPAVGRERPPVALTSRGLMHHRRTVGLVIPCRVASPQSPTPFHQATSE